MKKLVFIIFILIIMTVLFFVLSSRYGMKFGDINISINAEKQILEELTVNFLEDIEFKDFEKAATYHCKEDQDKVNIPKLIEDKFQIKPEYLDITKYEITDIEIDRSGERAKVKTKTIFKVLNTGRVEQLDMIFYFHRKPEVLNITEETIEKIKNLSGEKTISGENIEKLISIKDEGSSFEEENLKNKLVELEFSEDEIEIVLAHTEKNKDKNWYMELESSLKR